MTIVRPKLQLSGEDGNIFFILSRARKAAMAAGWTNEQFMEFYNEAASGDYDHALRVCQKYFDVE